MVIRKSTTNNHQFGFNWTGLLDCCKVPHSGQDRS